MVLVDPEPPAPTISAAMRRVLVHAGLALSERLQLRMRAHHEHRDRPVLLFPGEARLTAPEYIRYLLDSGRVGSVVFLLQAESDADLERIASGVRSFRAAASLPNVILGRQWFSWAAAAGSLPCAFNASHAGREASAVVRTVRAKYPRVQIQTLAVGRAYEWAAAMLPPSDV